MNLEAIYKRYPTQQDCIKHLEIVQWNNVPVCPYCDSKKQTPMPKELRYHCNGCHTSYSVTAKSIFHKTKVDLQKWFLAIHLTLQNGISARQLAKEIEVTKDTACFMVNRIKIADKELPDFIKHFLS
jgi:transposase-like protein